MIVVATVAAEEEEDIAMIDIEEIKMGSRYAQVKLYYA